MFEIGPSLQEARTRRGLSQADVQKAIRIRERYLTALEEEKWDLLPGEAYTKGFLRTYAEFLGLNGNLYIDEYNSRYSHHEEEPFVPEPVGQVSPRSVGLLRPLGAIAAIVAVVAAVAAWQLRSPGSTPPSTPTGGTAGAAVSKPASKPAAKPAAKPKKTAKPAAQTPTAPLLQQAVLSATRGRVWLQVRTGSATGKVLFEGVLEQGKTLPVSLVSPVWFRVGAPWNLDVRAGGHVLQGLPAQPRDMLLSQHGLSPAA